jgi:maspardin
MILSNLPSYEVDSEIADSIDFLVEKLESLDRSGLASRLTLNCMEGYVEPQKFKDIPVTIMDVNYTFQPQSEYITYLKYFSPGV